MGADAIIELVEARAGIRLPDRPGRRTLQAMLRGARREDCPDLTAYADLLARDPRALGRLLSGLTVGETYFFRDSAQMELLADLVLPEVALSGADAEVAMWSAGCSTGEEAYTLAMLSAELGLLERATVLGVDVSSDAIDHARAARYGSWALRGVDEKRRRAFFDEVDARSVVRPAIRARVRFTTGNLLDVPRGRFHVVLCRNVLLYLTPEARERAAATLRDALLPAGWLVTGASDPPLEIPGLHRTRTPLGLVYRLGASPVPRAVTAAPGAVIPPPMPPAPPSAPPARWRPPDPAPELEPASEPDAGSTFEHLRALADTVPPVAFERALSDALDTRPADAELRYLAALLHLDWGRAATAAEHARAAVFLDPGLAIAHLVLAHAEARRGNHLAARRSYRTTAALLSQRGSEVVWGGDGRRADELAALAIQLADRMRRAG